jgi:hypothetical protein
MNETLDQTLAHYNNAGGGILSTIHQHAFDRGEFCTVNGLKLQITTMLLTQLAAPYRRKDLKHQATGHFPGNWFGLEEIRFERIDGDMLKLRFTYRMDDNLCAVLKVPIASTCQMTEVDGKAISLDILGFDHSLQTLAEIERDLKNSMLLFLLRA